MKKTTTDYLLAAVGIALLGVGLYLVKSIAEPQGYMRALPYVCIGFGCGVFGHGFGGVISRRAMRADPEMEKRLEIERKDERNIVIVNSAKAKAFDLMTSVFGALMVALALMGVDTAAVLLLVFAYLFVQGYSIYYRVKFDKTM